MKPDQGTEAGIDNATARNSAEQRGTARNSAEARDGWSSYFTLSAESKISAFASLLYRRFTQASPIELAAMNGAIAENVK